MTALKIEKILFATDFLESSRLALDYALAIAHHFGAEIVMLHATELPPAAHEAEAVSGFPSVSRKLAQEALENLAQKVRRAGVRASTRVMEGVPDEVILEATKAEGFDLLILGVHGIHRGLSYLVLGSNTEKIVLAAPCPTLTVGAHVPAGVDLDLHLTGVLCLLSAEDGLSPVLSFAQRLATSFNVSLETKYFSELTARTSGGEVAQLDDSTPEEELAENHESELSHVDAPAQTITSAEMLHISRTQTRHLIVTSVDSTSLLERHMRPSFAYQLIANSVSPVITINRNSGSLRENTSQSPPS